MDKEVVCIAPFTEETALTDAQLIELIQETDFSKKQQAKGRDYCYFLDTVETIREETNN